MILHQFGHILCYKIKRIFPQLFYARWMGVSLPFINVSKRVTSFGNPYSHCSTTPKSCDLHTTSSRYYIPLTFDNMSSQTSSKTAMTSMSRIPIIMQLCIAKSLRVFISRLCMVSSQVCFAVKTTRAGKCFAYCLSNRLY